MRKIILHTSLGKSVIHIPGSLKDLADYFPPATTVVLADENVLKHYRDSLDGFMVIPVKPGEGSKSLGNYSAIFGKMLEAGVDRSWKLVAVGGGITTDLGGFVASTYFRGIDFAFVSTSLLGQVDAAIGGKNGINYMGYKNLIGVVRQPSFVLNDIESLKTLPEKEFRGGFSEIIKYGFIRNPGIYNYLDSKLETALAGDFAALEWLVYESVKVKTAIVESDVSETGDRKLLNFGHTFAHAIEKTGKWSHGDAVAAGMVLAAGLSRNLGFCAATVRDRLVGQLQRAGLPVTMDIPADDMLEAMLKDKKKSGKYLQFILLKDIGKAFVHQIEISDLKSILHDLYQSG